MPPVNANNSIKILLRTQFYTTRSPSLSLSRTLRNPSCFKYLSPGRPVVSVGLLWLWSGQ